MDSEVQKRRADEAAIQWAPRVSRAKIRQLYETDARGIYDAELLDEVGWALWSRADSIVAAAGAWRGEARCPKCKATVRVSDGSLRCECGWTASWEHYWQSIHHKQLSGASGPEDPPAQFLEKFPKAATPQEKMLLIDWLLHRLHSEDEDATRPLAVNFIEGRMNVIIRFLDNLAYGEQSTPGTKESRARWRGMGFVAAVLGGSKNAQERRGSGD